MPAVGTALMIIKQWREMGSKDQREKNKTKTVSQGPAHSSLPFTFSKKAVPPSRRRTGAPAVDWSPCNYFLTHRYMLNEHYPEPTYDQIKDLGERTHRTLRTRSQRNPSNQYKVTINREHRPYLQLYSVLCENVESANERSSLLSRPSIAGIT